MIADFEDIRSGLWLSGVIKGGDVNVVAFAPSGNSSGTLVYRTIEGQLGERLVIREDLCNFSVVKQRRWTFAADGEHFRLASEARRMKWAHLSDPFAAVETSNIEPYPHQIDAVYNRFLPQRPLRFLLADDPGAGKTIMSGLLIRELMLRGDVARCLIVAPGSLVEQWQDELWEKFQLDFEIMSRQAIEDSRTGNPFLDKNLLVARVDQLARAEDILAKLGAAEWDLVIVDEAHKMSARLYADKLNKTKRFALGELLGDHTRHLLLLTATPHNGKNEDFLAFMTLLDRDRFTGRLRNNELPDVSDVMRRLVKENLRTFDGTRLFPKRFATSLNFELSPPEQTLYDAVTDYVRHGMNRAARLAEAGDRRRGTLVGFALAGLQRRLASSPAAIYHSLRRRRDRLSQQATELRDLAASGKPIPLPSLPKGIKLADLEELDFDDYDDLELSELEDFTIDAATAAQTADELEAEVGELERLVELADELRASKVDTKWTELRDLLRSDNFKQAEGSRKLIIFTEHKDTLDYLTERVGFELGRPEAVVTIHGGLKREDRRVIQDRFRVDPTVKVLVATDAAGEGVNLQVANMMVNYDLPWNPNRIEQRFGRIHRIGQQFPCHLWNLVAYQTREGMVFDRLFQKIEEQKKVYKDQVYDVLGDAQINRSLQELLIKAIVDDGDPAHADYMNEIIDGEIGTQLESVLSEHALVSGLFDENRNKEVRQAMERAQARKLQPWFVESFFEAALTEFKGRIVKREAGRYEITRVPAAIRAIAKAQNGPVQERYERVTFDKRQIQPDGLKKADLIAPGTPLLGALVDQVLESYGETLGEGATLVAPNDNRTTPRVLVYLDHKITDGRRVNGERQVISRRFHYVEIDVEGHIFNPGDEPYLGYRPITSAESEALGDALDDAWADYALEDSAQAWAIEHLAGPHFDDVVTRVKDRVDRVREAVRERLTAEIQYWDKRAADLRAEEVAGKNVRLVASEAERRAEELEARLVRRRLELDLEEDVHNSPPTVVGAALIIPQGLLDVSGGRNANPDLSKIKAETDRRGVAAVVQAELSLGRIPTVQEHSNPGFDIESVDPVTGQHYFIEVKSHLPDTDQIVVSSQQVQKAKSNPDRWRLAVASVPIDPNETPAVKYLVEPFADVVVPFALASFSFRLGELMTRAGEPC